MRSLTSRALRCLHCCVVADAASSPRRRHRRRRQRRCRCSRPTPQKQLATIKQYCVGVSQRPREDGGVSFEGITPESIGQHADVFEKAVRKLRGRVMPPPGARQPDAAAVDSLVAWLETSLDRAAGQAHVPRQGRPAPAQSQGIRERGSRSAGRRLRCRRGAAGRRRRRRLRQHRGRRCRCRRRSSSSTSSPRAPWR